MDEAGGHLNAERRGATELEIGKQRVTVRGVIEDRGNLLPSYAAALALARHTTPNKVVGFRKDDLETLALFLGCDGHDIEARIRSLLDCTPEQARNIHAELLRKCLLRPAAAIAVGTAIIWGPAAAAQNDRPTFGPAPTTSPMPAPTTVVGDGPQVTSATLPTEFPTTSLPTGTTPPAEETMLAQNESAATATDPADREPDVGIPRGETPTEVFETP